MKQMIYSRNEKKKALNNMAGKGPEIRKGANLNAYWNNYDSIFRKKPETNTELSNEAKKAQIEGKERK